MGKKIEALKENVRYFIRWTVISLLIGGVVGVIGSVFGHGVIWATKFWQGHHWTVFLMPAAGVAIVGLYRLLHEQNNRGTDMVLDSVYAEGEVSLATAPLIFVSTILSHAVSASAGREGAALQLGGSLGNLIGRLVRLDAKDKRIAVMCGMSACFAALFGTPLAAGVFPMEMACIGVMYYAGLIPCLFSSFIGAAIARELGLSPEHYNIGAFPGFGIQEAVLSVLLGILCALASVLFCEMLHKASALYRKYFANPWIRVLAGSAIYIVLTLIFSDRLYNGGGLHLIERCFEGGSVPSYAFLLKIVFTAVALGAGFKGGEIVPTLCVGATLGYTAANLFGLPAGLCAGMCMMGLFVGVTNCPVSTAFMAFELFGFAAMPYFSIVIAVSFGLSGYSGLYHSQHFISYKTRIHRHSSALGAGYGEENVREGEVVREEEVVG